MRESTSNKLFNMSENKKKRKNAEALPVDVHPITGLPDLNVTPTEPDLILPQVEPTQCRRCGKEDESPKGFPRGIVVLVMKFSSKESIPSRDDLTSMFSAFGPLDPSETHISEESSGAQVAFVSSGDAIEALKSLKKANPFRETSVSFRLQPKVISAPGTGPPVITNIGFLSKLDKRPTSTNSMKQNLLRMTEMLEKSGDQVSQETKAKLKSDITALLEKVSSMPSSSSSS